MTKTRGNVTIGSIAVLVAVAALASLAHSVQKEQAKTEAIAAASSSEGGSCGAGGEGGSCGDAGGGGCGGPGGGGAPPFADSGSADAAFAVFIGAPVGPGGDPTSTRAIDEFLAFAATYPDDLKVTVRPSQHPDLADAGIDSAGVWFARSDGAEPELLGSFTDEPSDLIASVQRALDEAGVTATEAPAAAAPSCPATAAKATREVKTDGSGSEATGDDAAVCEDGSTIEAKDATCEDAAGCSGESCDDTCPVHGEVAEQV